jgi:protein TonB
MGLHNERYFFLSGLISLSLFAFLVILIGYSVLSSTKIEQFAMIQSEFVSVSIAVSEQNAQTETMSETPQTVTQPLEEQPVPVEEKVPEAAPEISDLFSQVKPHSEPKKNQEKAKRSEEFSALEKDIMTPAQKQRFTDKVKNIELVKPGLKMVVQGGSSGPIVNEYHAKIQGLIYAHFHPPTGSEGQAARVRIKISPTGKLVSYKVIAYSGNASLNSEIDWLKERLGSVLFPSHPEGRDAVLECILTAKE